MTWPNNTPTNFATHSIPDNLQKLFMFMCYTLIQNSNRPSIAIVRLTAWIVGQPTCTLSCVILGYFSGPILLHHMAATQSAAMHIADSSIAIDFPYFVGSSIWSLPGGSPVLRHCHPSVLTSSASPFGLCCHFSFGCNGFHQGMAIAIAMAEMLRTRPPGRETQIPRTRKSLKTTKNPKNGPPPKFLIAFLWHVPKRSSACNMEDFPRQNPKGDGREGDGTDRKCHKLS